jgi:hypothetical protein
MNQACHKCIRVSPTSGGLCISRNLFRATGRRSTDQAFRQALTGLHGSRRQAFST